jgi:hypothetical protein
MFEEPSKRTETEQVSRVDSLLGFLKNLSQRDPSPALRERLAVLASQRLNADAARFHGTDRKELSWLKPAFAATLLIASGFATVFYFYSRQHGPAQQNGTAGASHPAVSPDVTARVTSAAQPPVAKRPPLRRSQPAFMKPVTTRRLTMRLPYSNSAIETGTDATIRVSMSQSELLSLGFPINRTVEDRRIVAELTLGDDGLPRAISLPLPLEVMKEKE